MSRVHVLCVAEDSGELYTIRGNAVSCIELLSISGFNHSLGCGNQGFIISTLPDFGVINPGYQPTRHVGNKLAQIRGKPSCPLPAARCPAP